MTNPTQPIEHYTPTRALELVRQIKPEYPVDDNYTMLSTPQLVALLNLAVDEYLKRD